MSRSELKWLVPKRILLIQHYGDIKAESLSNVNDQMAQHLDEGEAPVHVISDSTEMGDFPTSANLLRKTMATLHDDRWGWIITVGVGSVVRFLVAIISSTFGLRVKTADSVEEAEQILRRVDMSIDALYDTAADSDMAAATDTREDH